MNVAKLAELLHNGFSAGVQRFDVSSGHAEAVNIRDDNALEFLQQFRNSDG